MGESLQIITEPGIPIPLTSGVAAGNPQWLAMLITRSGAFPLKNI
jgi:hypothetical protein